MQKALVVVSALLCMVPFSARAQVEEMCEKLLANPVIESYEVTVSAS